jgi:FkbM family methyltransferase
MSKVLLAIAVAAVLGLTGFLLWWFMFRNGSKSSGRVTEYMPPVKESVDKRILKEKEKTREGADSAVVPKVVYATYHDIDLVPHRVIEDLKRYCHGYKVEVYRHQSCEDFLYKYYGADVVQLFRELDPSTKSGLWALCRLYVDGGYYLDIREKFSGHISDLPSVTKTLNMFYRGQNPVALSSRPKAPALWNLIMGHFAKAEVIQQEGHVVRHDIATQAHKDFPVRFNSSVDELVYRHHNLPMVDPKKIDVPVLYINMDKHKERRKFLEAQLEGVANVTRVPGVLVTDRKHHPLPPHSVTNGELGCAMAHRNAWQTFVDNKDWEKVLILEDDASLKLSSRWRESLSRIQAPSFLAQGTTGYVLDRQTAKYLLQEFKRSTIDIGVDGWMWEKLFGEDYGISPENVGYSNSSRRRCHTLYYIYAYNAEEEAPTAIRDRSYGTRVREGYCKIASLLIKRSPQIGMLGIDSNGNTDKQIQKPRIALLDLDEGVALNLLSSYNSNHDVHVYTVYNSLLSRPEKVFVKERSDFDHPNFDVVIASRGHPEWPNSAILEEPTTAHVVDQDGFPTEKVRVHHARTFDFVEIGTSDFDTEVEKASDSTVGLSVEPLVEYYLRLPNKAQCVKENAAISDTPGTLPMYYVPPDTVKKLNLPSWITGSNALGEPHKLVLGELKKRGLTENLFETVPVPVLTFGQLMQKHKVEGIKYLKIDTEGHDPIILESMISYCDKHPHVYPIRVQFESNGLSDAERERKVIRKLEERGYKDITPDKENARDKVMIR